MIFFTAEFVVVR